MAATTSLQSAVRSHCRLKVHITANSDTLNLPQVIWSSVAFDSHPHVHDFCGKLCTKLGLEDEKVEVYLHDVLVPSWEVCSLMFKDNDELELRIYNTTVQSVNHPQCKNAVTEESHPSLKKKSKKRKRESIQSPPPAPRPNEFIESTSTRHGQALSTDAAKSYRSQNDVSSVECSNGHTSTGVVNGTDEKESRRLTETTELKPETPTGCRNRLKTLTPIELQLVEEMESLPKPKRKKKRRSKSCKIDLVPNNDNIPVSSDYVDVKPLNCSFQGSKMVFDSDGDNEIPNPVELSDCIVIVDKPADSTPSLSHVEVKPLQKQAATINDDKTDTKISDSLLSNPAVNQSADAHSTSAGNTHSSAANRRHRTSRPAVYKRERLKLRATISPAIHSELIRSQTEQSPESQVISVEENTTPKHVEGHQTNMDNGMVDVKTTETTSAYSRFPQLDGPPRINDRIAFKVLEMSDSYTPVISHFKEGQVVDYDAGSDLVQIKLLSKPTGERRTGIFDVCIEDDDGTLTNINEHQDQVVDRLSSLIDVRLIEGDI